jgi:hypothetical protein
MSTRIMAWLRSRLRRPLYLLSLLAALLGAVASVCAIYGTFHEATASPEAAKNGWKFSYGKGDNWFFIAIEPVPFIPMPELPSRITRNDQIPDLIPLPKPRPKPWEHSYRVVWFDQGDGEGVAKFEWRSCDDRPKPWICTQSPSYRRTHSVYPR